MIYVEGMGGILFVCDREKECSSSPFCGKECTHTKDIDHAKNFSRERVDYTEYLYTERIIK